MLDVAILRLKTQLLTGIAYVRQMYIALYLCFLDFTQSLISFITYLKSSCSLVLWLSKIAFTYYTNGPT